MGRWDMPSTSTAEPFDAIVVGAGQAGPGIATTLVDQGRRVALIEQDKVGGTCLNRGCRPTKALRASARIAHLARTAGQHGVCTGEVTVDFGAAMARKDALIDGWVDGYTESLGHTDGLALIHGQGRFFRIERSRPRDDGRRTTGRGTAHFPERRDARRGAPDRRARHGSVA